ncbi:LysR family transcriptional regulator [Sphingomonas sp. 7/4-4]|uniref:LysR family transcriptional regulator n=1 Tax=Sphingomonas sp. 7/4-4 TaxID=3018446 RepID=UPI0022F392CB|nr:LysR family transcriptional regulator [Sphingomonas sp. 7/4-4]WBY06493.1 LysR family transcriptional regulator [Sphingomonas sp. 7/4-4]
MPRAYNQTDGVNRGINNLKRMAYFAEVVEAGSFTAAAERLGITKAVVSQQVARLEEAFETTLLVRTTRSVRPTEEGRAFTRIARASCHRPRRPLMAWRPTIARPRACCG